MERTSAFAKHFSGQKPDDGHRAADTKSKDLRPVMRIVDGAIQDTGHPVKVLYLKQDLHGAPFLTANFDAPGQYPACKKPSLRASQHLDATAGETQRAVYWMNKLPDKPAVQAAGAALIELCARPSTTEFGLACTTELQQRHQALHDAINATDDALRGRQVPDSGHTGVFGSLRRSLTNRHSRSSSRSNSPKKRPGEFAQSPRQVSFSPDPDETHFVRVSPRKSALPAETPHTPRLSQERDPPPGLSPRTESGPPPQRALPALPPSARRSDRQAPSPRSPSLVLTEFERHRAHPQPSLRNTPPSSQRPSQQNTPGTTPRDAD